MNDLSSAPAAGCPRCAELAEIIVSLQAQVAQLEAEVRELRVRLHLHAGNSSLPPSANPPSAPAPVAKPPTGRKPGGQPGHPGHHRLRLPPERVNQVIAHLPTCCAHCQGPLPAQAGPDDPAPTWHQVAELPEVLAVVTEHQGQARTCPRCGHVTWGAIPAEVLAHGFGPRLTATVAFLSGRCHDSKRTVEEIVETVFGVPLSLGSVVNAEQEMAAALAAPHDEARQAVQQAPVKNADETGWAQAGHLCWLWVAVTSSVAFFQVCAGRGRAALRQLLGDVPQGVVSSDRWSAYGILDLRWRQVCWAHLKRDFQKWVDWGPPTAALGQAGLAAVQRIFGLWGDFRAGRLDRAGLRAGLDPVCLELYGALEAGLSCPEKKAARFCRNLLEVYPALWTFARVEGVEPTNNHAERTLRLGVLWRKISFGNHSEAGCRFAERILTTVQTLRLQNRHVLTYLREALIAHRAGQPAPALVPPGV